MWDIEKEAFKNGVGIESRAFYYNSIEVECSCGGKTILRFDESLMGADGKPGGRYISDDPKWQFRNSASSDARAKRWGWYCGKSNHEQARFDYILQTYI